MKTDNELIAEFMGMTSSVVHGKTLWNDENLRDYSTSWDWIMPVVAKCRPLWLKTQTDLSAELMVAMFDGNIEKTYTAVIKFIKWYNEQKK